MVNDPIRFNDGAGYERFMGQWSQIVGAMFLDWLAPKSGLRWLDVGCGNGAFTEMLAERCVPISLDGIDPSQQQLTHAQMRSALHGARFFQADAMALPFPDDAFDAAVMPLVIFFVPDPPRGVAEMARVVCPGGMVAAYAWDMDGGGFPYEVLRSEMRDLGIAFPMPPSPDASRIDVLESLWAGGGLVSVETREITAQRTFADFDDYWQTILVGPTFSSSFETMAPANVALLKARVRARLSEDASGRISCAARANAVKGQVPR